MKPYDELTTRGKAYRLRPLALSALDCYDIDVARLQLVRNDLNGIFRVWTSRGRSFLLRICLPDHHELITFQVETVWLQALEQEPDIHAPVPIASRDGEYIVRASAPGVPEPRNCMLFSWLHGQDIHRRTTPDDFRELGKLMARLHDHTDRWTPPTGFQIPTMNRLYPFGDPAGLTGETNMQHFDPPTRRRIAEIEDRISRLHDKLYASGNPQVIHADLHWGNVKVNRGILQRLDFEDLGQGFPAQDIAISLFYSLGDDRFSTLRDAFNQGYTEMRDWPESEDGQTDLLIAHRGLDLLNWLLTVNFPGREAWFPAFVSNIHGKYSRFAGLAV